MITGHVFANMTAFLLSAQSEETAELAELEEVLTDNPQAAISGALWELDQRLAGLGDQADKLVPTLIAFAEKLMEKLSLRAETLPRLDHSNQSSCSCMSRTHRPFITAGSLYSDGRRIALSVA